MIGDLKVDTYSVSGSVPRRSRWPREKRISGVESAAGGMDGSIADDGIQEFSCGP